MNGADDSGGPRDPEEPAGERPGVEGGDDTRLAHILSFVVREVPFSGALICGGCVYGIERLAPVVPISGRERTRR